MINKTNTTEGQVQEFINKTELAKRLKVSTRTIDNWTKDGIIPKIKIKGCTRYNWASVCESLNSINN